MDNSATTPPVKQVNHGAFCAPIKKEFLLPKRSPAVTSDAAAADSAKTDTSSSAPGQSDTTPKDGAAANTAPKKWTKEDKKARRGRNKKRPHDEKDNNRMCLAFVQGANCTRGDTCKFGHDIQDYMKRREKDLGERCVNYDLTGFCRFGATCRYGMCHINRITGENLKRSAEEGGVVPLEAPMNDLNNDVRMGLRKNTYPFKFQRRQQVVTKTKLRKQEEAKKKQQEEAAAAAAAAGEKKEGEGGAEAEAAAADTTAAAAAPAVAAPVPAASAEVEATQSLIAAAASSSTTDDSADTGMAASAGGKSFPLLAEKKGVDFEGKVYVAPLTTVGNLPYRRVLKDLGCDITCGEMAMSENVLQGQSSEWALLKRHKSEDVFGVQLAGAHADQMARVCELLTNHAEIDFVDLNVGCPIDLVCQRGAGSALMNRTNRLEEMVCAMTQSLRVPLVVKVRMGWDEKKPNAHTLLPSFLRSYACSSLPRVWDVAGSGGVGEGGGRVSRGAWVGAMTVHGRSRLQRYTRSADWNYIHRVVKSQEPNEVDPLLPVIGNGDVASFTEWEQHRRETGVATCLLGRGALIKPWLCTEIKERRHWDISSSERLDVLKKFVAYGLEHWGSDQKGVNNTRRFLLEWLSFMHRYIPVGLLETLPYRLHQRPEPYFGRDHLETLMSSPNAADWVKIAEMLLGPVPAGFEFLPKHKANAYSSAAQQQMQQMQQQQQREADIKAAVAAVTAGGGGSSA